jgi:hypothetical protein
LVSASPNVDSTRMRAISLPGSVMSNPVCGDFTRRPGVFTEKIMPGAMPCAFPPEMK